MIDTVEYYFNVKKALKDRKSFEIEESLRKKEEYYECCVNLKTKGHRCNCINADSDKGFSNRFVQHYPSCFTVEDTDYFSLNFNTQQELLECEFVSRFRQIVGFYRYSISRKAQYSPHTLMAEYKNGTEWWVAGYLKSLDGINLPIWKPVLEKKNYEN